MDRQRTEYLLEQLKSISQKEELGNFVAENKLSSGDLSFHKYFEELLSEKGLRTSSVVKDSLISRTYAYQILDGRKNPNRDKVIAFCLAAGLELSQVQKALTLSGNGELYSRSKRDAILIFAVNTRLDVMNANELLYEMEEGVLE
jgi:hypothetical protein